MRSHCEVSVEEGLLGHLCVLQSQSMVSVAILLAFVEFPASQSKFPVGYGWL
jgi:hypothetical protein